MYTKYGNNILAGNNIRNKNQFNKYIMNNIWNYINYKILSVTSVFIPVIQKDKISIGRFFLIKMILLLNHLHLINYCHTSTINFIEIDTCRNPLSCYISPIPNDTGGWSVN